MKRRPVATQSESESDSSSSSSSSEHEKKNNNDKKKGKVVLDSFTKDRDDRTLTVPDFALDSDKEDEVNKKKAKARIEAYNEDRQKELDAIKEIKKQNLVQFDPDVALGAKKPELAREEAWEASEVAEKAPEDDLFSLDPKTGKWKLTREPVIKRLTDYSVIPIDGTVIVAGIRRSGKSYALRDILYEFRHVLSKGMVFSATKFNGWWGEHIPEQHIHNELDGDLIEEFLKWRGEQIIEYRRQFGEDAEDDQNFFIILDDCVDQVTRYFNVRLMMTMILALERLRRGVLGCSDPRARPLRSSVVQ